jgi:hypothetical protein
VRTRRGHAPQYRALRGQLRPSKTQVCALSAAYLRKVFPKLGISSRRELRKALPYAGGRPDLYLAKGSRH